MNTVREELKHSSDIEEELQQILLPSGGTKKWISGKPKGIKIDRLLKIRCVKIDPEECPFGRSGSLAKCIGREGLHSTTRRTVGTRDLSERKWCIKWYLQTNTPIHNFGTSLVADCLKDRKDRKSPSPAI